GSGGLGDSLDHGLRGGDERRAGVGDDVPSLGVGVGSEGDGCHLELEVSGRGQGLVGDNGSETGSTYSSVGVDSSVDVLLGSLVL
ncbi:hypothetical protein PENTCL1PPCAC_30555, partial [Pristionchus entomophagus]